ncbi:MAG: hypothetical protein LBH76_10460 [Propionibacteriaceae bacterium]|jgi:hypothetical protein|nr:hypothetical protein [Propionibacteriaceae bacterium]
MRLGLFADLGLHADVPARAQPGIGEWGPVGVVATKRKRRARLLWPVVLTAAASALTAVGAVVFRLIADAVGL